MFMTISSLRSVRDALPFNELIQPPAPDSNLSLFGNLARLQGLLNQVDFMKNGLIPFVVQLMSLLMQRLVEVPLSAVVGRRAAALAMSMNYVAEGVEWLDQCLMIVWGGLNLRAPAPLDVARLHETRADLGSKLRMILLAFLGVCVDADLEPDGHASVAHPERMAYQLLERWLALVREARTDPMFGDLFKPTPFLSLLSAARATPVVMLSLWGSQCDALIIHSNSEDGWTHLHLDGVTESIAVDLQSKLRGGLFSLDVRSRGDDPPQDEFLQDDSDSRISKSYAQKRSYRDIEYVLAFLWNKVVKPIVVDGLKLQVSTSWHSSTRV
jgi:hypothetical protein